MGKEILVRCFDVIIIAFLPEKYTMKVHISNTKLEKGERYYIKTQHKDLFSHYNLILRKGLENTNEMCSCPLGIL